MKIFLTGRLLNIKLTQQQHLRGCNYQSNNFSYSTILLAHTLQDLLHYIARKYKLYFTTCEDCVLTLTDNSSIIMGVTVASVNEVAMRTAEQVCLRPITLDTTHSGRVGGVTE